MPGTYFCSQEWHGGQRVAADYFILHPYYVPSRDPRPMGFAVCMEHVARGLEFMFEAYPKTEFGIRKVTNA